MESLKHTSSFSTISCGYNSIDPLAHTEKREKAALSIQIAWRRCLAQSTLQILKQEKIRKSIKNFKPYLVELYFSKDHKEVMPIRYENEIELMVKKINDFFCQNHTSISIYFKEYSEGLPTPIWEIKKWMKCFQKRFSETNLQFSLPKMCSYLRVFPKPLKIENLGEGWTQRTYRSEITEIFLSIGQDHHGNRIFPDRTEEKGVFDERGDLVSGYRIGLNKEIKFINPKPLIPYQKVNVKNEFTIIEVEGELLVLEKTERNYIVSDIPIDEILLKASQRSKYSIEETIKKVLFHKEFSKLQKPFIEKVLKAKDLETPLIFGFSNIATLDIMEAISAIEGFDFDPLKIIDTVSKRNFFLDAAYRSNSKLLEKLIKLYPQEFSTIGLQVIAELLQQRNAISEVSKIAKEFERLGGIIDIFHRLWIQASQSKTKPGKNFINDLASITSESQLRKLYDTAFIYNNPFIHEPCESAITPDQYSINLMWVNKKKMASDQEFLFGKGSTFSDRELDFHERFVKPVSKWARKNPGSTINIWVDSDMATSEAIEQSKSALEDFLKDTPHGTIQFRDVRSIDTVSTNPEVFSEKIPVYFRVDLLRAIAADYILKQKETQFFVYGDIDMKALSAKELFDKRTVGFLNDFGFVMAKAGFGLCFENGFQIFNGDNSQFMDSHRKVIIDLSIEMANKIPDDIGDQQIYDTYPAMVTHFLHADGRYGKLRDLTFVLEDFRYDRFRNLAHYTLPLGEGKTKLRDIMPIKPVRLPPSHF